VKNRGYPAGVSWLNYLSESRQSLTGQPHYSSMEEVPLITLNLEAYGKLVKIQVKEGETIQHIADILGRACSVPPALSNNLLDLVQTSIKQSGEVLVNQGRIFIR
jgi:hypothetical protein